MIGAGQNSGFFRCLETVGGRRWIDNARWCLSVSCNLCVVVMRCSALVRTSVFACACPFVRARLSEFCVARWDSTTGRTARDQTHWRVIHCPVLYAPVCFGSVCLGFHGI